MHGMAAAWAAGDEWGWTKSRGKMGGCTTTRSSFGWQRTCGLIGAASWVPSSPCSCTPAPSWPSPAIVGWTIDSYIRTGDLSGLNLVVFLFVIVSFVQFVSNYIHLRLMAYVGQRVLYKLRVDLFGHLQRLSMSFFDRNEVGRVMSRVQNDVQQLQEFISIMVVTLADVLSLGGIIAVMVAMNAKLALISLSVIPLLFLLMGVWQRYARIKFLRARRAIAGVNAGLQENITGVRVVQSLNRRGRIRASLAKRTSKTSAPPFRPAAMRLFSFPPWEMLTALGLALVVFFGGMMALQDPPAITVGALVAFVLYIYRFFEPVRNLTMQYGSLQRAMVSGSRIFEVMDVKPVEDPPGALELSAVRGEVRYEGGGVPLPGGEPVLQDVDLHFPAGQTVALVGPTGAGKTTLASLLLRLYDATEGRLTIDGHDIREVSLDSLARQISIVSGALLFSGTIKENIRYNHTDASGEQV